VTLLRVDRSPIRLFLVGLVGLLLMISAIDIMWGHWLSTPPDTYNDEITSKGRNQRRADYAWGAFFILGGAGLFGYAVTSLIRRSPAMVLREDGVVLTIGAPGEEPVFVPWSAIDSITSSAVKDPDGGYDRDVLVIDMRDPAGLPAEPWGAEWDGNRLVVDADGWETPIGEIVIHAEIAMERAHNFPGAMSAAFDPQPAALETAPPEAPSGDRAAPGVVETGPEGGEDDHARETGAAFTEDDSEEVADD
jgi:hypothetical protein